MEGGGGRDAGVPFPYLSQDRRTLPEVTGHGVKRHLSYRELELSGGKGGWAREERSVLQVTPSVGLSGQMEHEVWVRASTPVWPCYVAVDLSLASVSSVP